MNRVPRLGYREAPSPQATPASLEVSGIRTRATCESTYSSIQIARRCTKGLRPRTRRPTPFWLLAVGAGCRPRRKKVTRHEIGSQWWASPHQNIDAAIPRSQSRRRTLATPGSRGCGTTASPLSRKCPRAPQIPWRSGPGPELAFRAHLSGELPPVACRLVKLTGNGGVVLPLWGWQQDRPLAFTQRMISRRLPAKRLVRSSAKFPGFISWRSFQPCRTSRDTKCC